MSTFDVTILGCGSATPTTRHMPSCQAVRHGGRLMLVDCGEGAQLQLRRYGLSFAKISDIFISHLHGDHFLGLPGLLSTMALHDIGSPVTVHTFAEGADILRRIMDIFCRERSYELRYNIIEPGRTQQIYEDRTLTVTAFPLYHRVPCVGFRFDEKPKRRHINGEAARYYDVPHYLMDALRDGADLERPDGTIVPNSALTTDPSPAASYAYCSDTMYDPRVAEAVRGIDTLYHEATYGDERAAHAAPRGHSTARQAGAIATAAGARTLVIGHYSKTIADEAALAAEAAATFSGTIIPATEGLTIPLAP